MASDDEDLFASGDGGSSVFDIRAYLGLLRKYWWFVTGCLLAGLVCGLVLVKLSAPEFISTAEFKVERRAPSGGISLSGSGQGEATTTEDLKTIEKSFASPALMRRVTAAIRSKEGFEDLRFAGHAAAQLSDGAVAGYLMLGCSVQLIPDTRLIRVSFRNGDPAMSQKIANLIVNEGIQNDLDQRVAATGSNVRFLQDEVAKAEENLRKSEEKLNAYTRTLGNVSIDGDLNIVANELKELNARATAAKAERLRLESDYTQVKNAAGDFDKLIKIESIQKIPSVVAISSQIGEVETKIAKLSLRYRESSPFMKQARSELSELRESLVIEVLQAPKNLEAALATARRNEDAINKEQAAQEEKVIQLRDLSVPSGVFQRQIDANRLAYEAALKRLSEELSQARNQPVLLQVVNPADYGYPAGSGTVKTLGIALFLGALLGFGGVFLLMQLDSSVRTVEDAERSFAVSVLSAIPEYSPASEANDVPFDNACPAFSDRSSPTAEALRSLRLALGSVPDGAGSAPLLISGSLDGEGTSFCALNLAVVIAQSGQRVLLVDANFRSPSLEQTIFDSRGRPGLMEFLHRESRLANIIHATPVTMLDVVTAGRPSAFPAESLSPQRVAEFLAEAKPLYDRIIVDAAPLAKVSDTLAIARLFPLVCLVVRAGRTPRAAARRSLEMLRRSGARPTGLVLNFAGAEFVAPRTADTSAGSPEEVDEPLCGSCGAVFADGTPGQNVRRCECGREVLVKRTEHRDTSQAGDYRRRVFGDLLARLESAGLSKEEARSQLLLTLKVWRNEDLRELSEDATGSSAERVRLFTTVLDRLVAAGFSPEEAHRRLAGAIETWRSAP